MKRPKGPLFLARAPYRRRRLRDAARLLPVVGAFLLLLPLLWAPDSTMSLTSGDVIYFFLVWLGLIGLAAAFAPGLRGGDGADDEED
jgi:peptidoglycan/LPS O-acetylase OafA/YrhL